MSAGTRGRPRAADAAARRARVIDAAFDELVDRGYDKVTMSGIARRAGASKETLYSWFGNRDGLFATLIGENADEAAARVAAALAADDDARDTLIAFADGRLTLLTSERSIALNRAAMSSPALATVLLAGGRHRIGPLVETYLTALHDAGVIDAPDPSGAFGLLYGLTIRDTQIRVLLGEPAPPASMRHTDAVEAVDRFLALLAV